MFSNTLFVVLFSLSFSAYTAQALPINSANCAPPVVSFVTLTKTHTVTAAAATGTTSSSQKGAIGGEASSAAVLIVASAAKSPTAKATTSTSKTTSGAVKGVVGGKASSTGVLKATSVSVKTTSAKVTTSTSKTTSSAAGSKVTSKGSKGSTTTSTSSKSTTTSVAGGLKGVGTTSVVSKGTSTTTSTAASATSSGTNNAATNGTTGDPQTSLTLDPRVLATGFENDGQSVPAAGQVPSKISSNNFLNFCMTVPNLPITNGAQVQGGSCNPAPMGVIASTNNMPSSKFVFPPNFGTVQANTAFTVQMAISHLETGNFVNAQQNYFAAPQVTNGAGDVQGHSHVVIELIDSLTQTTPTTPQKFAFFKGLNGVAVNGILTADVTAGLPAGVYRMASINAAANHQPVLVAVAQHGALDDMVYFTVTDSGAPANTTTAVSSVAAAAAVVSSAAPVAAKSAPVTTASVAAAAAGAGSSVSATATAKGSKGSNTSAAPANAAVSTSSSKAKGKATATGTSSAAATATAIH